MTIFTKEELKRCSKNQLIEIITNIQQGNMINILPIKTSENSSIPSSKDIAKNETKKDEVKKRGPKKGHKGVSRKSALTPDIIIYKKIEKCPRTGEPINSTSNSYHAHQIIELIPGVVQTIEIRRQTTTGPDGKTVVAPNIDGIKNNQRFGPFLKTWISTLRYRFHMEWDNIQELFYLLYNETISKGAINNIFNELKKEFETEYKELKKKLKKANVLGIDESGARIDGSKAWTWVFHTEDMTYFTVENNRSHKVVEDTIGKIFDGVIVSDFYGAYSEKFTKARGFQKCLEHLKRDTKFSYEINSNEDGFSKKLLDLLYDSFRLKAKNIFGSKVFNAGVKRLEDRLKLIMLDEKNCKTKMENRLRKRLIKYQDHIFTFLKNKDVPFDNNGSERDIRKWVIFRKIYGCFRSEVGAENLAVIFSIIETCKKNGISYFDKIKDAFQANAFTKAISPP